MNRRQFLAFLSVGAAAATVAPHVGLLERIRSYFFAPRGGWLSRPLPNQIDFLSTSHAYTLYGGAAGGGKMLRIADIDRLVRDYYQPAIVAHMNRDSLLFNAIEASALEPLSGIPVVFDEFLPAGKPLLLRQEKMFARTRFLSYPLTEL